MFHNIRITLIGVAAVGIATATLSAQQEAPLTPDEVAAVLSLQARQAVAARDIPPGYWLMDGDMQMPLSFNPSVDGNFLTNLWPGGVVPYGFAPGFSTATMNSIVASMQVWQSLANVAFIPRTNQADWVLIQPSTGNNSAVGRTGGQQIINFAAGQASSVYVHELGHCIGFLHEQQRPDRNFSIQIIQANVQAAYYGANFPIVTNGTAWGPYDFGSIMHYDRCAFSTACATGATCNCTSAQETMQALGANYPIWQTVMGNASAPSYRDGMTARGLYPFPSDRWNDTTAGPAPTGAFLNPWAFNVATAAAQTPSGGTLFLKLDTTYHGVGLYTNPVTIVSPAGIATIGS